MTADNKSTYATFTEAFADEDRGGRFKTGQPTTVVGATSVPNYPTGPAWRADPTGVEPPLNYSVDALEPCGEAHEVRQSLEAKQSEVAPPERSPLSSAQATSGDPTAAPSTKSPG
ncbi:MAG: hypothetical protein WB689_31780 [Xanthobacteraceae bacterium]